MALKRKLAEDEQELIAPTVEVTGVDVEDGGDVVPDVADGDSLGVKLEMKDNIIGGILIYCIGPHGLII